jgi:hypothetical protein
MVILYKEGYWYFKEIHPTSLTMKAPKRMQTCFAFKQGQKWESPFFHSAWAKGFEPIYLFHIICCNIPSDMSNLYSHLLSKTILFILMS